MKIEYWACIIITWTVFFDSLRDGFKESDIGWWQWHIIKWCQFIPIIVYVMILTLEKWYWWLGLAVVSWIVWRIGINVVCKKGWKSMWFWWLK